MAKKVHILEGTSGGWKYVACGRLAAPQTETVGRAVIIEGKRGDEVTCKLCRASYAGFLNPEKTDA